MERLTRQQAAAKETADVKIMQKINAVHRESFAVKFPNQMEHILRLTAERLQAGLDKRDSVDITRSDTWRLSPQEIADLSEAVYYQFLVREAIKNSETE